MSYARFHVNFDVKKLFMRNLLIAYFPESKLDDGFEINNKPEGVWAIRISLCSYFKIFALLMMSPPANMQIIFTFTTLFASQTIESKQRQGTKKRQ